MTIEVTIDELIAFMETRAPGFSERIKGSTADRLAKLEKVAGRPLPPLYRAYMERMGRSPAEFLPDEHWNLDTDLVLGAIRRTVYPRERFVLFAVDQRKVWWEFAHLYFDRDDNDAVVSFEHGDPHDAHPTREELSFADFLISRAARIFVLRAKPMRQGFDLAIGDSPFADGMERAIAILARAGFAPCVTPTRHTWLGHRNTTLVFVCTLARPERLLYWVYIVGADAADVMALIPAETKFPRDP